MIKHLQRLQKRDLKRKMLRLTRSAARHDRAIVVQHRVVDNLKRIQSVSNDFDGLTAEERREMDQIIENSRIRY